MKKINYFGKEYTVSDDIKWVATSSRGNVFTFTEEPEIFRDTWVAAGIGARIDIWGIATYNWKNSLRKVEDILAREGHPHTDLMLKYAMIAQYDDKPWENFECDVGGGGWFGMIGSLFHDGYNYRLKPQEPKIQVGQVWTSKEGVDVMVDTPSDVQNIYFRYRLGGLTIKNAVGTNHFLQNFKRKE